MISPSLGILTRTEIYEYLNRPIGDGLFISPILEDDQICDTSIDLRLGHRILIPNTSSVGTLDIFEQDRDEIDLDHYQEIHLHFGAGFNFHPGQNVLVGTLEYIGMPNDLEGYVTLRSSFSRLPILANTATIHPSFRGVITLSFTSMAAGPIVLRPGERVAQLQLHRLANYVSRDHESRYDMAIGPSPSQLHLDPELRFLRPTVEPIIIGLVSTLGAGRTNAVKYLQERHGFDVFSLAENLKAEANHLGITVNRANLQKLGDDLRESHGSAYLAEKLRGSRKWQMNKNPYVVADGFKHPDEVREFRKQKRFHLLAIDAPLDIRWKRTSQLRRMGDPTTIEEFEKLDARDRGMDSNSHFGLNVNGVMDVADYKIINDGTLQDFYNKLEKIVQEILFR